MEFVFHTVSVCAGLKHVGIISPRFLMLLSLSNCVSVHMRTHAQRFGLIPSFSKDSSLTTSLTPRIVYLITSHLRPDPTANTSRPAVALLLPSTCSVLTLWLRSQPQLEPQHHISPPDTL